MQKIEKDIKKLDELSDNDIIKSILEGNKEHFGILQKRYKRIISNLIKKMIRDEDDIDDLIQDTFIKSYNALPSFQFTYSFSSWIYRIASNTCIDFIRKKKFNFVYIDEHTGDDDEPVYEIKDTSYQPDLEYHNKEKMEILKRAIDALPENYKAIIKLRHEDELEYQEISDKLKLPLGTVKVHLFRARKQLYDALKNQQINLNIEY